MRLPQTPPDADQLFQKAVENGRYALFMRLNEIGAQSQSIYLHWDELRFKPPPEGLSPQDWWLLLKLWRRSQVQMVPLRAAGGRSFGWVQWHKITEALHRIDVGLGGTMQTPEAVTHPEMRDRYLIRSLSEEAITSSLLEGAVVTREVAKQLIRTRRPARDKSERMILNNYLTMRKIRDLQKEEITPSRVLELHRMITDETLDDPKAAGRLRKEDERIRVVNEEGTVFHDPPPAGELKERMKMMCAFANGKTPDGFLHPALRAIILHFWLAYDHPFVDGNGRMARALFYWSMLRSGYWLCEFISISHVILKAPVQYYKAFLHAETDDNDVTYFIVHQLDVVLRATEDLHQYIKHQTQRMNALRSRLSGVDVLNHRQRALVEHALGHPDSEYTIDAHQASHDVVYQTARSDLLDLAKRGLLHKYKVGRVMHFRPAKDLDEKLAGEAVE
ncbi:MAG: Fic family protein [Planctomycetota bacterium]